MISLLGLLLRRGLLVGLAGLCLAAGAGALFPFSTVRQRLDGYSGDGAAEAYTHEVHDRFRFGLAMFAVGAAGVWVLVQRSSVCSADGCRRMLDRLHVDARVLAADLYQWMRVNGFSLLVVLVVSLAFRVPHLDVPLRYDEAHTVVKYASQPAWLVVTRYDEPNNHILHSLLVRGSMRVWGEGLTAIRLPVLAAGIALAFTGVLAGAALAGRWAGLLAGLLLAVWPAAVEYSVNARGYMPASVLLVGSGLTGVYALSRANSCAAMMAATMTSLSLWTIPSALYGVFALTLGLTMEAIFLAPANAARLRVTWLLIWGGASAALTLLLWTPTILATGLSNLLAIGSGQPLAWNRFTGAAPTALTEAAQFVFRDVPPETSVLLLVGLIGGAVTARPILGRRARTGICGGLAILGMLMLQRVHPPARTWSLMIAPMVIIGVAGWVGVMGGDGRRPTLRWIAAAASLAAVVSLGWSAACSDWIMSGERVATFRPAAQVVDYLLTAAVPGEPVIAVTPASAPLVYYARRAGLEKSHFDVPGRTGPAPNTALVVCSRWMPQTPADVLGELKLDALYAPESAVVLRVIDEAEISRIQLKATAADDP